MPIIKKELLTRPFSFTKVNKDDDEPQENLEINAESSSETTTETNQEI